MKLSIIIPVYNEKNTVEELINLVNSVNLGQIQKELIVVDDGSSDGTRDILRSLNIPNLKVLFHKKNIGKGGAIRTGIKHTTGDIVIIQDADMEYDPNDYMSLIQPIIAKKTKVVYGSRKLHPDYTGKTAHFTFVLGGNMMTLATRILYNTKITDEATCYKVFSADLIKNIKLKCKGFEFCPEITAKILKRGHKIHEVPIKYNPRLLSEGKKIKFSDGIIGLWTLLKYRFIE